MKKQTFHISHFTLHTLILLAGVMMFTACSDSDDNNSGGDSKAPFEVPNVHWGDTQEQVTSAMGKYNVVYSEPGYLVFFGNAPVYSYDFTFDSDKLCNYEVYLSEENGLKEKLLSYLRSEYTEVIPTAKTRDDVDFLGFFYNKDTQVMLSSLTYEDGEVEYCISYVDANHKWEE